MPEHVVDDRRTAELAVRVAALRDGQGTVVVAIDGLGGSGKSHLAAALATKLRTDGGVVSIVHGDDFFVPSECRSSATPAEKPIGADFDWRRLRDEVIDPLRHGRDARYQVYDWNRDALVEWQTVSRDAIVVVEGVYTLRSELRELYDFRVWVDCPRHLRLTRGIARDAEGARSQWERDWMPSEDRYVSECQPMASADVIVSGTSETER